MVVNGRSVYFTSALDKYFTSNWPGKTKREKKKNASVPLRAAVSNLKIDLN